MDQFSNRHLGPSQSEIKDMLETLKVSSIDNLIDVTVPQKIRSTQPLDIPEAISEHEYLRELKTIAQKNKVFRSYIGQGYYNTLTPTVILRTIFENPSWYTQYTPYQAEISQGRLEALLNFQTMVSDLTGMELANASLLDEGTAAAEGMALAYGVKNKRAKTPITKFFVDANTFEQTIAVVAGKAEPLGIEIVIGEWKKAELDESYFGALVQYPNGDGTIEDYKKFADQLKSNKQMLVVAADLMSLTVLASPGSWGADIVVGNTQRFGVPMGFGGPHAAFFATSESYKRQIPGRIIGISRDRHENVALRMALQTREQHIKREKATSNICTAQALLAIMASMYACYHGPKGLRSIGEKIHDNTKSLQHYLKSRNYNLVNDTFFDTLTLKVSEAELETIIDRSVEKEINVFYDDTTVRISLDESVTRADLEDIKYVFSGNKEIGYTNGIHYGIPTGLTRELDYLTHPVFSSHHTETKMMRYIKSLENKDLSLVHSMIPLGSCTMKLNSAAELEPITWPEWNQIHPFAPDSQKLGYKELVEQLDAMMCACTGLDKFSFQPNSGAQGEYAGLLIIKNYLKSIHQEQRNICLIPQSAHGTNPASAVMAGFKVKVVKCDSHGNVSLKDLEAKLEALKDQVGALMITYPSTHGVFEPTIKEICQKVHDAGGQVYLDGANLNAQIGLCSPGEYGIDVCHLNLHKTFCIPHGGGGPGVGPIGVAKHLVGFLPQDPSQAYDSEKRACGAVASAYWGSASILPISWMYCRMMGPTGLREASEAAILNANYIAKRLESHYQVLYKGMNNRVAHECIIDIRPIKKQTKINVEDIAKRLIDYGFHAPTMSWPVPETLMIEPTESESKKEIDRFCDAMIGIVEETKKVEQGVWPLEDNPLKNAPHTQDELLSEEWHHPYSRQVAVAPNENAWQHKFWPTVKRVNNAHGDRNFVCSCPSMDEYG